MKCGLAVSDHTQARQYAACRSACEVKVKAEAAVVAAPIQDICAQAASESVVETLVSGKSQTPSR